MPGAVSPFVDIALAAVDIIAVVYVMRGSFARRHLLAEARRHLGETLRGQRHHPAWTTGSPMSRCGGTPRTLTRPRPGRRPPPPDLITYTARWHRPRPRWVSALDRQVRAASAYERAKTASRILGARPGASRTHHRSCGAVGSQGRQERPYD
ncbi:hypothetical protein [Streptomyces sp. C36]|uniref:hypothetical protein n=1 Tax=Streptomyces sp. C36 TaxID=3237122 RepID=UPI0034C6B6A9